MGDWTLEIIKRSDAAKGFLLLPRRQATFTTVGTGAINYADS